MFSRRAHPFSPATPALFSAALGILFFLLPFGTPGELERRAEDRVTVFRSGLDTYFRTTFTADTDLVHRFVIPAVGCGCNRIWQPASWALLPANAVSDQSLREAFEPPTPFSSSTGTRLYPEIDNAPAYRMNGVFVGGNHGLPGWTLTLAGSTHGIAPGSPWTIAGKPYLVAQVIDDQHLLVTSKIGGRDRYFWSELSSKPPSQGIMYGQGIGEGSRALAYGDVEPTQLPPAIQNVLYRLRDAKGNDLAENETHAQDVVRASLSYRIPNPVSLLDALAQPSPSEQTPANLDAIPSQVAIAADYLFSPTGATTVYADATALQPHKQDYFWPAQHQALPVNPGETLYFFAEGVEPFASGEKQAQGDVKDFSRLADITRNQAAYDFDRPVWKPATYWADGRQHPPTLFLYATRDTKGRFTRRYVMVNDDLEGLSATDPATRSGFLSPANKFYPVQGYARTMSAGETVRAVGAFGFMPPDSDSQALVNFAYPLLDGRSGFRWHGLKGGLNHYPVPVGKQFAGYQIRVLKRAASVDIHASVVTADGHILISTRGEGGFSAILEAPHAADVRVAGVSSTP